MVVRVGTFNIRNGVANDGTNSWQFRKHLVVRAIRSMALDVAGLQEVFWPQRDVLRAAMPEFEQFGEHRDGGRHEEASLIIYRHERVSLIEGGNVWLSETPDVPGSRSWGTGHARMASWARLKIRSTGARFVTINSHLDHRSGPARLHAAGILAKLADRVASGDPVVAIGDFDSEPHSAPHKRLIRGAGFRDAWDAAPEPRSSGGTYHGWDPGNAGRMPRIDWILVSPGVSVRSIRLSTYHERGRYPSDHFAVHAELLL